MAVKVTDAQARKAKTHIAEVVRHGEAIQLPEKMSVDDAIKTLQDLQKRQEEIMVQHASFDAFPWDGAHAMALAIEKLYGFSFAKPVPGFWGEQPPQQIAIEVGYDRDGKLQTLNVPWGRQALPGWSKESYIQTGINQKDGRIVFQLSANMKRKYEAEFNRLCETIREVLKTKSIYKGKAVKVQFTNEHGELNEMPVPQFLDLRSIHEGDLIFPDKVYRAIRNSVFTPIERREECQALGVPFKRGVLLAGPFGTGKTMAAYVAAAKAVENGVSFIYCAKANDLPHACRFAIQYQPAVIFCEDIDRVVQGERTPEMDEILNIVDGIENKKADLMVVLTTNDVERINQAMLRPGRLDAVIHVEPPDADAVKRLITLYARGLVDGTEDLTTVAKELEGKIPAVIRECVERSKLAQVALTPKGQKVTRISPEALLDSAQTMKMQLDLLYADRSAKPTAAQLIGQGLTEHITKEVGEMVRKDLRYILNDVMEDRGL